MSLPPTLPLRHLAQRLGSHLRRDKEEDCAVEGADVLHLFLRRGRVDLHEEAEGPAAGPAGELLPSREVAGIQPCLSGSTTRVMTYGRVV